MQEVKKQRTSVTLKSSTIDTLQIARKFTNRTWSDLIDELVEVADPTIRATYEIVQKARQLEQHATDTLKQQMNDAHAQAEQLQTDAQHLLAGLNTEVTRQLKIVRDDQDSDPRPVIRG